MIGVLKGVVEAIGPDEVILDVHGVGYLVGASAQTLARLEPGMSVIIHIETHVREDALKLYGFLDDAERAWFVHLQGIQGVGAKAALALLDVMPVNEIANAAALGDKTAFGQAKGVGPKLAMRLATELKGKTPPQGRSFSIGLTPHSVSGDGVASTPVSPTETNGVAREDAVSALLNLGYHETMAREAVALVLRDAGQDAALGDVIRKSLKELAP